MGLPTVGSLELLQSIIEFLQDFVDENLSQATDPDGNVRDTLQKVINEVRRSNSAYNFETLAELNAAGTPQQIANDDDADVDIMCRVWNDPIAANNGLYGWSDAWIKSDYDPLSLIESADYKQAVTEYVKANFTYQERIAIANLGFEEIESDEFVGGYMTETGEVPLGFDKDGKTHLKLTEGYEKEIADRGFQDFNDVNYVGGIVDDNGNLSLAFDSQGRSDFIPTPTTMSRIVNGVNTELDSMLTGAAMPRAAGQLMYVLTHQLRDATVLVGSDSTGNESWEWVYLLSEKYAETFPAYTVEYYLWDVVNKAWPTTPEKLQNGTSGRVLRIYNGGVGGSRPDYMLGERFDNYAKGINADLLICNYGHNFAYDAENSSYVNSNLCKYIEFIDSVISYNPQAGCIIVGQNPQRTNEKQRLVIDAANKVAGLLNCDFVDVYSEFEVRDRDIELYLDGDVVHPNSNGMALFLERLWNHHGSISAKTARTLGDVAGGSLIPDDVANLANWDGVGLPNGFIKSGNATVEKNTSIFGDSGYASVKVSPTTPGAGNVFIQHTLDALTVRQVRGKKLIVGMCFYRPLAATPETSGKVEILLSDGSRIASAEHTNLPIGGWHMRFISADIPANETSIKLNFYADAATDSASSIYIDSITAFTL